MSTLPDSQIGLTEQLKNMFPRPEAVHQEDESLTVLNPERRATAQSGSSLQSLSGSGSTPNSQLSGLTASSIWHRLFPPSSADAAIGESLPADPRGVRIGHFEIENRIGSGGMGAVFRALDTRLNRDVALKVLSPALSRDPAAVKRFHNEARAAARLDHENIARVFFIGEDHGLNFIAFEFITGTTIRELIRRRGQLEVAEAVNYTLQIAAALQHTSTHGVVHRDIKPSNIIITPKGRAKLVDLGLARSEKGDGSVDLTMAGTTLGTFDYISPEQAKDPRNVDVRSDIYSLGCTLYHMLTGEPPYPEGTMLQKLLDHQRNAAPDPRTKNPRVPPVLSNVVRGMMAGDAEKRYASPELLIKDLMPIAAGYGFRGVSAEGLVWMSQELPRPGFAQRNLGWIIMTTALLLFVAVLDRYPRLGQKQFNGGTSGENIASPAENQTGNDEQQLAAQDRGRAASSGRGDIKSSTGGTAIQTAADVSRKTPMVGIDLDDLPVEARKPNQQGGPTNGETSIVMNTVRSLLGDRSQRSLNDAIDVNGDFPELFDDPDLPFNLARQFAGSDLSSRGDSSRAKVGTSNSSKPASDSSRDDDTDKAVAPKPDENDKTTTGTDSVASTGSGTRPSTSDTGTDSKNGKNAEVELAPFVILDSQGMPRKSFRTLEAACQEAADGSVIELRFNGTQSSKPIKISEKTITIRSPQKYQPTIEFIPETISGQGDLTRMITVINGTLNIFDVHLRMNIDNKFVGDQWSVFQLQAARQLNLERVLVTINNPDRRSATVCEIQSPPTGNIPNMNMMNKRPAREPYQVELKRSFVRGICRLFDVKTTEPGRFSLQESGAAVDGNFMQIWGDQFKAAEGQRLELKLEHATLLLGESLVRVECGNQFPLELLPLYVTARNNLMSLREGQALISMEGSMAVSDFQRLFRWNGENNFHHQTGTFWSIYSTQALAAERKTLNFDDWQKASGSILDVGLRNDPIAWRGDWRQKQFAELIPGDLELLPNPQRNPALIGASDGGAVGADLGDLPIVPVENSAASAPL